MRRHIPLLVALLLALTVAPGAAQGSIEILTPVHGVFAAIEGMEVNGLYQERLNLIDGFTGNVTTIDYDQLSLSREFHWSPDGSQFAIPSRSLSAVSIWREADDLIQEFALTSSQAYEPLGWSSDGQSLFLQSHEFGAPGTRSHSLLRYDLATGVQTTLLTFHDDELVTNLPLPATVSQFRFWSIMQIRPNPVFDEWVLVQLYSEEPIEGGIYVTYVDLTVLWNWQTGATLSLNNFLGSEISSSPIPWHPDGLRLYLVAYANRQYTDHIVLFDPVLESLEDIQSAGETPTAMRFWLGAGNLMIGSRYDDDARQAIYYLAEMQDSGWQSTELMRLERSGVHGWQLKASEEERRQLSCMFDQTLPSQLDAGITGQVAFTDGTPSRLRSAPDRYSQQVTLMAEGTPFTVLDGPTCMDGYRWWQLRLADGMVGWAAEADTTTYFLEPLL